MLFRIFRKWFIKLTLIYAILTVFSIAALGGWGTPFYRVKQEYGRVITRVNGVREIKTEPSIYFRFSSLNFIYDTKEYSRRVEYIYLDSDPKPHEMQAADKVKFYGAGVWTYKITDLYKFGVQMGNKALEMLTAELNGVAKAILQSYPVETIVTNIEYINNQVNNCMDVKRIEAKYGIKIYSFRLMHAVYPQELNEGTAAAKKIKIISEAVKEAAPNIASAQETLAKANEFRLKRLIEGSGVTTEEGRQKALETLKDLSLYEMLEKKPAGDTIFVIPYGSGPNITLPSAGFHFRKEKKPAAEFESKPESDWKIGVPPG